MLENEGVALRAIRWSEIFPWLGIGKSFRIALNLRLIVFGAAGLLLTLLAWWTIARIFSHDGNINPSWSEAFNDNSAWQVIDDSVADRPFEDSWLPGANKPAGAAGLEVHRMTPLLSAWYTFSRPVLQILGRDPKSDTPMTAGDVVALLLSALSSLAIWAFFGAAICRVAAVELATGERVGWAAAVRWACEKWLAYFSAPLIPMIGVTLAIVPVFLLGLAMHSNFFAAIGGLIWFLVLIAAFIMTLLLTGVLLGWPLMWATISVEGTDSFDALSRTYAYVFQKPLRYLLYIIIAIVVGWLGWLVVENFAAAVVWLGAWSASWGTGTDRMKEILTNGSDSAPHTAHALIGFWNGVVKLLALGYVFSYFGVASTAIYYQMRRDTDARETDEVFLESDLSEKNFGLPKLQKDSQGAPEIAPVAPTTAAADSQSSEGSKNDSQ